MAMKKETNISLPDPADILAEIPFDIPIKEIILQPGIANRAVEICKKWGERGLLVNDENTRDFVKTGLKTHTLPGLHKATLKTAEEISRKGADFFVAVGSGSLNDMVKHAAHLAGKPYIVFATAPSMNGYASANASLIDADGFKKSFSATAPQGIYLDTEILAAAPKRLIISGIGDAICRSTSEADALLSAQLLKTPDYQEYFGLLRSIEENIFEAVNGKVEALARTLVFGGAAMLKAGNSAPASQGEHMLAHYMELKQPDAGSSFHGEQIAVTTLKMAELQEKLINQGSIEIASIDEEKILTHFGGELGEYCIGQTTEKYSKIKDVKFRPDMRRIEKNLIRARDLKEKLKSVEAPISPAEIGWDMYVFDEALAYAKYTRNRLTFLDLA